MKKELVIVLDFGGQYNQLVARRVRECNVYCEIYSYKTDLEKIKAMNPKGIILTGGPNSCYEADSPTYSKELFELGIPVLGLCYGAQLMMHVLGGKVEKADHREYGKTEVLVDKTSSRIFEGVSEKTICWMSHFDYISQVAPGFEITSHTDNCPCASSENAEKGLYAIQFHPEVLHTQEGSKMLYNFVRGVCGCSGDWRMDNFLESQPIKGSGKESGQETPNSLVFSLNSSLNIFSVLNIKPSISKITALICGFLKYSIKHCVPKSLIPRSIRSTYSLMTRFTPYKGKFASCTAIFKSFTKCFT